MLDFLVCLFVYSACQEDCVTLKSANTATEDTQTVGKVSLSKQSSEEYLKINEKKKVKEKSNAETC